MERFNFSSHWHVDLFEADILKEEILRRLKLEYPDSLEEFIVKEVLTPDDNTYFIRGNIWDCPAYKGDDPDGHFYCIYIKNLDIFIPMLCQELLNVYLTKETYYLITFFKKPESCARGLIIQKYKNGVIEDVCHDFSEALG